MGPFGNLNKPKTHILNISEVHQTSKTVFIDKFTSIM